MIRNEHHHVTHRSEEPVSKSKFKVCPPISTGHRYSESYSSGEAETVPSLLAAATSTSTGAFLLYLPYNLASAAGPDLMKGFGTDCGTVNFAFEFPTTIGVDVAMEKRKDMALNLIYICMVIIIIMAGRRNTLLFKSIADGTGILKQESFRSYIRSNFTKSPRCLGAA